MPCLREISINQKHHLCHVEHTLKEPIKVFIWPKLLRIKIGPSHEHALLYKSMRKMLLIIVIAPCLIRLVSALGVFK